MRWFIAGVLVACSASPVAAQIGAGVQTSGGAVYRPQTAMSALGRTGMLTNAEAPAAGFGPRVAARVGGSTPGGPAAKPFSNRPVASGPTISPYLNLFREESRDAAPNYFTFVRPQQEQQEMSLRQQAQLEQLQRQIQQTSYAAPVGGRSRAARYGDTGRFYSGWKR